MVNNEKDAESCGKEANIAIIVYMVITSLLFSIFVEGVFNVNT